MHPPSQFNYSYVPNSNLLATITGPAHTVTNYYEPNRDVLDIKQNKAGTTLISQYDYTVNALGQRSNVAQTGTAFAAARSTAWAYDPLGQVTRADSTIPGLDRAYQFDLIGNRLKTADSLTLPVANNYTPNALNQYSSITNPQSAILNPLHDADGNMTSGPLPANVNANSTLVWDGENRLIQATVGTTGSVVRYSYDSQSRRIAETVGTTTKLTVYDGWNPIAEYAIQNSTFTIQNSYLWGIDLSGTLQGAGGVGGLLMTSLITNNSITSNYFPTYDGNGNVSEYLNESGEVSAHYEYDPFGKTTVATGPKANDFAHRFSTKPLDATTGLYYYGYRFYDPETGRWPSRDPIEERGGINLYGFVGNDGVNWLDILGMAPGESYKTQDLASKAALADAFALTQKNGIENCGWILKNGDNCFTYDEPRNQAEDSPELIRAAARARALNWSQEKIDAVINEKKKGNCYAGAKPDKAVAFYHTHGTRPPPPAAQDFSSEYFSDGDMDGFDRDEVDGHLVTPDGRIAKYVPDPDSKRNRRNSKNVDYYDPDSKQWRKGLMDPNNNGRPNVKPYLNK